MPSIIRKRKDLFEFRFYNKKLYDKPKSIYMSTKNFTITEINEMYKEMCAEFKKGNFNPWEHEVSFGEPDAHTLRQAKDTYLSLAKQQLSEGAYNVYRICLEQLCRRLGESRDVTSIKLSELEHFIGTFKAYRTRKTKAIAVNGMFDMLLQDGVLNRKLKVVAKGGVPKKKKDYLTMEDFEHLEYEYLNRHIGHTGTEYHADVWFLGMHFGFRLSEVSNFKPSWLSDELSLMTYGDSEFTPKYRTVDSLDTLPVLDEAKERLAKIIAGKAPSEPVFEVTDLAIAHHFKKIAKLVFPDKYLTYHSLRKSFAMYLATDLKVHPKVLHEMMRHGSMEVTMKFYTDKEISLLEEAINQKSGTYVVQENDSNFAKRVKSLEGNHLRLVQ